MPIVDRNNWEKFLSRHPYAHILQTDLWGELKSKYGWDNKFIITRQTGAQMLLRRLPLGLKIAYVPKGPVGNFDSAFLEEMYEIARAENALVVYIEPDFLAGDSRTELFAAAGFSPANISIQAMARLPP